MAYGLLIAPDGEPVPGGYYCWSHGSRIIKEFAKKLHERWRLVPLEKASPAQS